MLPECPAGAGGLPPPQVGDTTQLEFQKQNLNQVRHSLFLSLTLKYQLTDNATEKRLLNCRFVFVYPDEDQ